MNTNPTLHLAVEAALNKMTESGHFSICMIDEIIRTTGTVPNPEAHGILRLLHCVDFKTMPRDLLDRIPGLIQDCISGPAFRLTVRLESEATEIAPAKKRAWPLRLLGAKT